MERVRLAIWDYQPSPASSTYPTASEIIKLAGVTSSTGYACLARMERLGEVQLEKDKKGKLHVVPKGSRFAGSESEQLIYENLTSNDPNVQSVGLKALDELSRTNRVRNEDLLKYVTNRTRLRSPSVLRILTRQVDLAKKDSDRARLYKLGVRRDDAEKIARNADEKPALREEAYMYLTLIDPTSAIKVGLEIISSDKPDEALDSTELTQFWINLSGELAKAAATQPSVRRQLTDMMKKQDLASERAKKILNTLPQTHPVQPRPTQTQPENRHKTRSKREARTKQNRAEQGRTSTNSTEQSRTRRKRPRSTSKQS